MVDKAEAEEAIEEEEEAPADNEPQVQLLDQEEARLRRRARIQLSKTLNLELLLRKISPQRRNKLRLRWSMQLCNKTETIIYLLKNREAAPIPPQPWANSEET